MTVGYQCEEGFSAPVSQGLNACSGPDCPVNLGTICRQEDDDEVRLEVESSILLIFKISHVSDRFAITVM